MKTQTDVLCLMHQLKFREIRATRWLLWYSDFTKFDFGRGSVPDPDGETYDHAPRLPSGLGEGIQGISPSLFITPSGVEVRCQTHKIQDVCKSIFICNVM